MGAALPVGGWAVQGAGLLGRRAAVPGTSSRPCERARVPGKSCGAPIFAGPCKQSAWLLECSSDTPLSPLSSAASLPSIPSARNHAGGCLRFSGQLRQGCAPAGPAAAIAAPGSYRHPEMRIGLLSGALPSRLPPLPPPQTCSTAAPRPASTSSTRSSPSAARPRMAWCAWRPGET